MEEFVILDIPSEVSACTPFLERWFAPLLGSGAFELLASAEPTAAAPASTGALGPPLFALITTDWDKLDR